MHKENWDTMMKEEDKIKVDVNKAWINVHGRLKREELIPPRTTERNIRMQVPYALKLAAAILLFGGLTTLTYLAVTPADRAVRMSANTMTEQKFGLSLPDGSSVDLNAGSKLRYKLQRSGTRLVSLEGEAFFRVQADGLSPFIIRAGDGRIHVTGTSFSVRTVPGKDRIEVYVESGNVQFYRSRLQDKRLSLKAGQKGILENKRLSFNDIKEENYLSWKTRKLIFRDTRLGDVAGVLNRTYSRDIRFADEMLEDCLFTGTFDEQPIDSVIKVIQVAFNLDLEQDGKAYVLSGNGCN
jgi:ferric-dicitrate binding protein FerR (iron transport regulator)